MSENEQRDRARLYVMGQAGAEETLENFFEYIGYAMNNCWGLAITVYDGRALFARGFASIPLAEVIKAVKECATGMRLAVILGYDSDEPGALTEAYNSIMALTNAGICNFAIYSCDQKVLEKIHKLFGDNINIGLVLDDPADVFELPLEENDLIFADLVITGQDYEVSDILEMVDYVRRFQPEISFWILDAIISDCARLINCQVGVVTNFQGDIIELLTG